MLDQIFNLNLDQKTLSFLNTDIPKNLDSNTKKYLEGFIHFSNNSIKDIRAFLLENESCEKCFCWTCAFTIIGLIPFCCWLCKKKKDRLEMKNKIKDCFSQCADDSMKKLDKTECMIYFKEKETNSGNQAKKGSESNVDFNFYFEIHLFKAITAKPFDHLSKNARRDNALVTLRDKVTLNNGEGINTQRNNENDCNNDVVDYKSGNYNLNNQIMNGAYNSDMAHCDQKDQMHYANVYQGNCHLNNQLDSNMNLNLNSKGYISQNNYKPSPYYNNGM